MGYSDEFDRWFSKAAIEVRQETGWASDLSAKANRVLLQPVLMEFGGDSLGEDLAGVAATTIRTLRDGNTKSIEVHNGLSDLGARLCLSPPEIAELDDDLINRFFPNYGALSRRNQSTVTADPFNLLLFFLRQVGLIAAQRGWALAVAEDDFGNGPGVFSWIPPEEFEKALFLESIVPPSAVGIEDLFEFDELVKSKVGADRLLFILTREVSIKVMTIAPTPNSSEEEVFGLVRADLLPHVKRGLELISQGEHEPKPFSIAKQIVEECGSAPRGKWAKGSGKIIATSHEAAIDILGRKLSELLKTQKK